MAYNTAYISQMTVGATTYDIKDAWAREKVEALGNATHFLGVTTSAIEDGSTTNPIAITGKGNVTAQSGDIVMKNQADGKPTLEFIWNGTSWQEFGSTGSLKELAFHTAADLTVSTDVVIPQLTLTGTEATISHTVSEDVTVTATGKYDKATSGSFSYLTVTGATTGGAVTLSYDTVKVLDNAGSKTDGSAAKLTYEDVTVTYLGSVKTEGTLPSINAGFFSPGEFPTLSGGVATKIDTSKFKGGSPASLDEGFVTAGSDASLSAGTQASWNASVIGEVLSFSFTPNTLQTLSGGVATKIDTSKFKGGSPASLDEGFVTAGSDASLSAGTLPSVDTLKFNAGAMPTFENGSSTSTIINSWKTNTPTAVTLPTFKDASLANGVASFTQPSVVTTSYTTGSVTIGHTETNIDVAGTIEAADIKIANHKYTPAGTIATQTIKTTGSVSIKV